MYHTLPQPIKARDLLCDTTVLIDGYEVVQYEDSAEGEYVLWHISGEASEHGEYRLPEEIKFY